MASGITPITLCCYSINLKFRTTWTTGQWDHGTTQATALSLMTRNEIGWCSYYGFSCSFFFKDSFEYNFLLFL